MPVCYTELSRGSQGLLSLQMTFDEEHFKAAIDKGTLDALLPDVTHEAIAVAMLADVWRVVRCMGCYMIVSLAQDHVLKALVDYFKDK